MLATGKKTLPVGPVSLVGALGLVSTKDMAEHPMQHLLWRVLVERPCGEQHKKDF